MQNLLDTNIKDVVNFISLQIIALEKNQRKAYTDISVNLFLFNNNTAAEKYIDSQLNTEKAN